MTKSLTAVAICASAALAVAACGGGSDQASGPTATTLRLGGPQAPTTLDPAGTGIDVAEKGQPVGPPSSRAATESDARRSCLVTVASRAVCRSRRRLGGHPDRPCPRRSRCS